MIRKCRAGLLADAHCIWWCRSISDRGTVHWPFDARGTRPAGSWNTPARAVLAHTVSLGYANVLLVLDPCFKKSRYLTWRIVRPNSGGSPTGAPNRNTSRLLWMSLKGEIPRLSMSSVTEDEQHRTMGLSHRQKGSWIGRCSSMGQEGGVLLSFFPRHTPPFRHTPPTLVEMEALRCQVSLLTWQPRSMVFGIFLVSGYYALVSLSCLVHIISRCWSLLMASGPFPWRILHPH